MGKKISAVIFWGAVWGLVEATLGYVLHSLSLSVGWFFWFPLAYFFMDRVYKQTGSSISVLCTAAIAAIIKLVDFLFPVRIDMVINPAVSILLEGLVVFAAIKISEHKQDFYRFRYLEALTVSVGWRVLYILYIFLMPAFYFNLSPLRAINPFMKFFLLESVMNSLIIYAYLKITERINNRNENVEQIVEQVDNRIFKRLIAYIDTHIALRISLSFSVLVLAFYVQWVF